MPLLKKWDHQFPNCPPVGYLLREAFPNRWVRFHSLPESKRYPDDDTEYAIVIYRHNFVMGALTGAARSVILLATAYSQSPVPDHLQPELRTLMPTAMPWRSVPMHELEGAEKPNFWHFYARECEWHPGLFDPIIRLVADDVVRNIIIADRDCRWLLHPYDGGMDVLAELSSARDRVKSLHADWLSARADGL
jgi:hypothetical protein